MPHNPVHPRPVFAPVDVQATEHGKEMVDLACKLLFLSPLKLAHADYDHVQKYTCSRPICSIRDVAILLEKTLAVACKTGWDLAQSHEETLGVFFSPRTLECMYSYAMDNMGTTVEVGLTNSCMLSQWMFFELLDDHQSIKVFTPQQRDILDVSEGFPQFCYGPLRVYNDDLHHNDRPNFLLEIGYAASMKAVCEIMNNMYEDLPGCDFGWAPWAHRFHHICWLPCGISFDTVKVLERLNVSLQEECRDDAAERDFSGMARFSIGTEHASGRRYIELRLLDEEEQ